MGDLVFLNDKAYLTVMTGSMSEVHSDNQNWLKQYGLLDSRYRIETYSLITIEKVKKQEDLKVGDVVAYRDSNKNVIVHRIVSITTTPVKDKNRSAPLYFQLRGDANNTSTDDEKSLSFDKILGKYDGQKNLGLGAIVVYIQSNIGLIAICFAVLIIFFVSLYEDKLITYSRQRMFYVAKLLDDGEFVFESTDKKLQYVRRVRGYRIVQSEQPFDDASLQYHRRIQGFRKIETNDDQNHHDYTNK